MSSTEAALGERGGAKTARIPIKVAPATALPKPAWIRVQLPQSERFRAVKQVLLTPDFRGRADLALDVDMLTVGQYLQPRPGNLVVQRYAAPSQFDALALQARAMGFAHAACGPLVRSSYHADRQAQAAGI